MAGLKSLAVHVWTLGRSLPAPGWATHRELPLLPPAHLPGGAVQGVGQPGQHPGGTRGGRPAGEELADLQGPGREDAVPAEMAGHRRQLPLRDQELRESPRPRPRSSLRLPPSPFNLDPPPPLSPPPQVLQTLGTETYRPSSASQCVAGIACAEIPVTQWPELIPQLVANVTDPSSTEHMKESTLEAIGYICQDIVSTPPPPLGAALVQPSGSGSSR